MTTNKWSIKFTSIEKQNGFFSWPQKHLGGLLLDRLDPEHQISEFLFWANVQSPWCSHGGRPQATAPAIYHLNTAVNSHFISHFKSHTYMFLTWGGGEAPRLLLKVPPGAASEWCILSLFSITTPAAALSPERATISRGLGPGSVSDDVTWQENKPHICVSGHSA